MVALSLFSLGRFNTYSSYAQLSSHSSVVIENIYQSELHLRDIDRAERGYMLTKDTMYIRYLNNSIDSINHDIKDIEELTSDNQEQLKNITLLKASVAIRIAKVRDNVAYIDTAKSSLSAYYFDSRKFMQECSRKLKEIHDIEDDIKSRRFEGVQFYQELTTNTLRYLLFVFCIITLVLFIIMTKELRGRMQFQVELQAKVIDLRRSHSELQEIAYVASHDLQEPLRKIQVFSDMLLYQRQEGIDKESKVTLERISNSANRMQSLITDLMSLTSLTKIDEFKTPLDINRMLQYILIDIEDKVKEKGAIVEYANMPKINGYEHQLKILFLALFDNALKFTKNGVNPQIKVSWQQTTGEELADINPNLKTKRFNKISVADNGIGFDNKFISKLFRIFQRLHAQHSEYEGKGIGLAICQRIMANHEGYITAHGAPDMGAKFDLFFPVES